jgi:hypothetical protein
VRTARPAKLAYLPPESKKMSTDLGKINKKFLFSVSGLLARTLIYSGICTGIIASFYDFKLKTITAPSAAPLSEAIKDIASINEAQQTYYVKNNKFSDSLEKLGRKAKQQRNSYTYKILSSMGPVQTSRNNREAPKFESAIAIATSPNRGSKSYIGAVFAFRRLKKPFIYPLTTKSAICESDQVNLIPPTFDGIKINCPPGTTLLRSTYPGKARNRPLPLYLPRRGQKPGFLVDF